jgi:hypothetical protein
LVRFSSILDRRPGLSTWHFLATTVESRRFNYNPTTEPQITEKTKTFTPPWSNVFASNNSGDNGAKNHFSQT